MKSADGNPMRGTCMRRNEPTKKRRGWKRRIAAGVAAAGLLAALTVQPGFAAEEKPEPTEPTPAPTPTPYQEILAGGLSITVTAPSEEAFAELEDAGVVLDVYKIASAVSFDDKKEYDSYKFDENWGDFSAQKTAWDAAVAKAKETEGGSVTAADIEALTQGAAGVILADIPEYTPGEKAEEVQTAPDYTGVLKFSDSEDAAISLVKDGEADPGLFLILAHGGLADYKLTEDGRLFTVAEGETQLFVFAPMLVSVPTRGRNVFTGSVEVLDETYDSAVGDTASAEDWIGNITMTAKVGVKDRLGALKIIKKLEEHSHLEYTSEDEETQEETKVVRVDYSTCVFDVTIYENEEAAENEETPIFSRTYSVSFSETGEQEVALIEDLPVGSVAVITEVYSGNYTPVEKEQTVKIEPLSDDGEVQTVTFNNIYDGTWKGSGAVDNTYRTKTTTITNGEQQVEWDLGSVEQKYFAELEA